MPYTVEADRFRFIQPGDPVGAQQYIEFLPVNAIHIGPGEPPFTDCIHTGAVAAFPVIDKTENIKNQGFHGHRMSPATCVPAKDTGASLIYQPLRQPPHWARRRLHALDTY